MDLIVDEPFDSCFTFPLFTEEFCKKIRRSRTLILLIDMKITQQQICFTKSVWMIYNDVLKEYVKLKYIYGVEKGWDI